MTIPTLGRLGTQPSAAFTSVAALSHQEGRFLGRSRHIAKFVAIVKKRAEGWAVGDLSRRVCGRGFQVKGRLPTLDKTTGKHALPSR